MRRDTTAKSKSLCHGNESIGRIHFRPMYAQGNMGHPYSTNHRGCEMESDASAFNLICTGLKFSRPRSTGSGQALRDSLTQTL